MSFLKKLFGGGKSDAAANKDAPSIEYEGFMVRSTPQSDGGQFRLCGIISKEVEGELREQQFIRADLLPTADEAHEACFRKSRRVIDEQGERLLG